MPREPGINSKPEAKRVYFWTPEREPCEFTGIFSDKKRAANLDLAGQASRAAAEEPTNLKQSAVQPCDWQSYQ